MYGDNLKPQRTQRNAAEGAEELVMEVSRGDAATFWRRGRFRLRSASPHFAKDDSS
jgi:hypothetical protein